MLARRLEVDRSILARDAERLPALVCDESRHGPSGGGQAIGRDLAALSPYATLERGYSIVRGPNGVVLRDARSVKSGDPIVVKLQRGEIGARVDSVRDSGS